MLLFREDKENICFGCVGGIPRKNLSERKNQPLSLFKITYTQNKIGLSFQCNIAKSIYICCNLIRGILTIMKHHYIFKLDCRFQKEYSGYLTLFFKGCIREKKCLFFLIQIFHHMLTMCLDLSWVKYYFTCCCTATDHWLLVS